MNDTREAQMVTTAEEYVRARKSIKAAEDAARAAQAELNRLRLHMEGRRKDLAEYVGRNITSRCIRTKAGEVVIVRHAEHGSFDKLKDCTVAVYGLDGEKLA